MTLSPSQAEVDAFVATCDRLHGFAPHMGPEWADGYLTALAAGPRAIAIDEWLPVMCGEAFERCFADPADAAAARASLSAHARQLARQLDPERLLDDPDTLHLSPLMWTWDEEGRAQAVAADEVAAEDAHELVTGGNWSEGFFDALRDFSADWSCEADVRDRLDFELLLEQIDILRSSDNSPRMAEHLSTFVAGSKGTPAPDRDELIAIATNAVQELRVWWLDHGVKPATVHAAPKPGRNEPCPCGSGKKYKKCHGA
jgi:uncharacterized protein